METIYVVIGYCNYYPAPDNTLGVFNSYQSAADVIRAQEAEIRLYEEICK